MNLKNSFKKIKLFILYMVIMIMTSMDFLILKKNCNIFQGHAQEN